MKRNIRTRSAFTLIELLVVITIIAILAAILFPVFARVREKARQTACLSNEKQISMGLLQYVQDFDETTPYLFYGSNGAASDPAANRYKWMDAIYTYVKSEAVFNCPDSKFPQVDTAGTPESFYEYHYYQNLKSLDSPSFIYYYGSYGYNSMYRNDGGGGGTKRTPPCGYSVTGSIGLPIARMPVPSTTVWITDGVNYYTGYPTYSVQPAKIVNKAVDPPKFFTGTTGTNNDNVIGRHTGMSNVIYCDGHCKPVTLDSLATKNPISSVLSAFTIEDD